MTEDAHSGFGSSGTDQPSHTHYFASAQVEADILGHQTVGILWMVDAPMLYTEHLLADVRFVLRITIGHRSADHIADQGIHVQGVLLIDPTITDGLSVPDHLDGIR